MPISNEPNNAEPILGTVMFVLLGLIVGPFLAYITVKLVSARVL
jgi:hypothetical protein